MPWPWQWNFNKTSDFFDALVRDITKAAAVVFANKMQGFAAPSSFTTILCVDILQSGDHGPDC